MSAGAMVLSPDCEPGKHQACPGQAFDPVADDVRACGCICHWTGVNARDVADFDRGRREAAALIAGVDAASGIERLRAAARAPLMDPQARADLTLLLHERDRLSAAVARVLRLSDSAELYRVPLRPADVRVALRGRS